jgi:hypothetical protein
MSRKVFEFADLEIWERGGRFFARYDAGAHQIVMREDEISEAEVLQAKEGEQGVAKMLFALQKRLISAGIDPYVSNVSFTDSEL